MTKTHQAKFFCENCGAEVPPNAKYCRHCGRFFSSVRCPVCGTTGRTDEFENGCPHCGYAGVSQNRKKNKAVSYKQKKYDDSLPVWVYGLTIFGLLLILLLVFIIK